MSAKNKPMIQNSIILSVLENAVLVLIPLISTQTIV